MPTMKSAQQTSRVCGHLGAPLHSAHRMVHHARRWHWDPQCGGFTNADRTRVPAATVMALICSQADQGHYPCPLCALDVVLDTLAGPAGDGHHFVACSALHTGDDQPHCPLCAALTRHAATRVAQVAAAGGRVAALLPGPLPATHAVWVLNRMGLATGTTSETVTATSASSWASAAGLIADGTNLQVALEAAAALHGGVAHTSAGTPA